MSDINKQEITEVSGGQVAQNVHGNQVYIGNQNITVKYNYSDFSLHSFKINERYKITNNHQIIRLSKDEWIVELIINKYKAVIVGNDEFLPVIHLAKVIGLYKTDKEIDDILGELKSYMVQFNIYNLNGSIDRTENKFFKSEKKAFKYLINTINDLENLI